MVAYTYSAMGVDTGETGIASVDVASRRRLLTTPNVAGFTDACVIEFREIKDLVVTDHGSIAWILRVGHHCKTVTFQVYDASMASGPALLDEGLGIEPASLRVSARAVSWETDGERRYARLA